MEPIAFAPLPQRRSLLRQWHKVTGPRGKRPFTFGCLSPDLTALWVHFDNSTRRLAPCKGEGQCSYCAENTPRRWMGYAAGIMADTRDKVVAEVTEGAARQLVERGLLPGKLRGLVITLFRLKDHRNAPVQVKTEKAKAGAHIPEAFDPMPHLLRLWGYNEAHHGQLAADLDAARAAVVGPLGNALAIGEVAG